MNHSAAWGSLEPMASSFVIVLVVMGLWIRGGWKLAQWDSFGKPWIFWTPEDRIVRRKLIVQSALLYALMLLLELGQRFG